MKIYSLLLLFFISCSNSENTPIKIIHFDYSNISPINKEFISIFESIDYYLSILFRKKEFKDYNYFNKMYRDLSQNKLNCAYRNIKYDWKSLIQRDISFLILPKLIKKEKINENYNFTTLVCKDEYEIPRSIVINFIYKNENILEKILKDEIQKKYLFYRLIQIIFEQTGLEFHNLKRNKLISPFPEKYLYFDSYEKFVDITAQDKNAYLNYFKNIGKFPFWPKMPYFNDYFEKNNTMKDSLQLSFTEITLNLLAEYPYEVAHCDLLFYERKKCFRVDQKCVDVCSMEKYFMEYYIDEKNKRLICNLKNKNDLKNRKCGSLYGNVFFKDSMEPKKLKEYTESKQIQKILLLKPSPKCPNTHPRTIFFEYTDYYRDAPYYYMKNNIKIDYLELKDPKYFVIGKIDKKESYMAKYRTLLSNNILSNNLPDWNYNLYWDAYPNLENDRGVFFKYNKYQLIGKFPDENIDKYNIILFYNKYNYKYPKEYNYISETLLWPENKRQINKKFYYYKYNKDDIWMIEKENLTKNKYPYALKSYDEIKNSNNEEKFILNRYISNPMLINQKKFTMKSFVLVTGFSPLKIYFYRDGYLTFSQKKFSLDESDLDDFCIHIPLEKNEFDCVDNTTNFYYEKSLFDEKCIIWNYLNFERYCKKNDINYQNIINQIKDIIIKTFISLSSDINNKINKSRIKDRNMFQLFTFDFILDTDQKIYLIDIDKNPKLNSKHLAPVYIYDHIISDVLNIVGVVPFAHDQLQKTFDENVYKYENEVNENVDDALCEFTREKGVFELVFPLKKNINEYKKYFEKITEENKLLWKKLQDSNDEYN